MTKIITISDLHGKDVWKDINPDNYDKIIFLGDYVDAPYRKITDAAYIDTIGSRVMVNETHGKTGGEIIYNLKEIIEFKDKYPDKVELLLGNHDVPYVYHIKNKSLQRNMMCSGYRYSIEDELAVLFNKNIRKFKIAYQFENVMWSHAGITPQAYKAYFKNRINDNFDILVDELNKWFILNEPELFYISYERGGSMLNGSILWADKKEWLQEDYKFPFIQIVGHSHVQNISYLYDDKKITDQVLLKEANVTFTDCLNTQTKFHELEL